MGKPIGIYIHVPFCGKKCPYCDFYSLPFRKPKMEAYLNALLADIYSYRGKKISADTLYFGGGTPSLLPPVSIASLIESVKETFSFSGEATLEANPNTVTQESLSEYRKAGINRISLGLQSGNDAELQALGRSHSVKQGTAAVFAASAAGFCNISADIMVGIPYQTKDSLLQTLRFVTGLPVTHISAYLLKTEPETSYWGNPILQHCPEEDQTAALYLEMVSFLEKKGFVQYEISNFAVPGYAGRHNLKYWRCQEYLGFGPAAHSFRSGIRFCNPPDLEGYLRSSGSSPIITDSHAGGLSEQVMLGLHLCEGIPLALLDPIPPERKKAFREKAVGLERTGFVRLQKERLYLTTKGFLLSNSVIAELLNELPETE